MRFSDIPRNPDAKTLRQFGLIGLVVFGSMAVSLAMRGHWIWSVAVGIVATLMASAAQLQPQRLKPVFVGWMILVFPIAFVVSHLILASLFFIIFFPLGFLLRKLGHDPLRLSLKNAESYWEPKPAKIDIQRYFRQY